MPYKEKLKNLSPNPRRKPQYKVSNWTQYNKSLKKRGAVSLYFPPGELKPHFINQTSYIKGISGQQSTYKQPYIELIYTFYRLFNWGIRQMTEFFEDLWRTKNLDISVPSFGHLKDHLQQSDSTYVAEVLADSGYDGHETYSQLESINIKAIIPPARGSPSCIEEPVSSRLKAVKYINEKGIYAWQNKNKYGRRSQVENMMYRYKEIIGRKVNARLWNNQDAEMHLGCFIMNTFTKLGMPITVKM